ncbi:MAG: sulfatase [Caldilineaceae bacterium]
MKAPNLIFVFADQWRYAATGFGGDPNVQTPNLDRLAQQSLNFAHAISGSPVCCPARASLLTGRYPDQHGVFVNDVCLSNDAVSLAQAFRAGGYDAAYVGKWHLDGHGRSSYIPPERRQGFEFLEVLECTHYYNRSAYYRGDDPQRRYWPEYDAIGQTRSAQRYIEEHADGNPFLLVVSWGPPHNPYETAPARYRQMYDPAALTLPPNVPPDRADVARAELAGYYAHCTALDDLLGDLLQTVDDAGIADDTIFVFWSDHGDMLHSQGEVRKQRPWEESIHVPLLIRHPRHFGAGRTVPALINTPDLMPTLLGLCDLPIPATVSGANYAPYLRGQAAAPADSALLACYHPFGEYHRGVGGREYRGLRTATHTYARDLNGPWLLYDNVADPYQQHNLVNHPQAAARQTELDQALTIKLQELGDQFLPGMDYIQQWGYEIDETGTVPYHGYGI